MNIEKVRKISSSELLKKPIYFTVFYEFINLSIFENFPDIPLNVGEQPSCNLQSDLELEIIQHNIKIFYKPEFIDQLYLAKIITQLELLECKLEECKIPNRLIFTYFGKTRIR